MLLSIIIVNYNSAEMLFNCLQSIYDSKISFEHEIIVVDNASSDDSIQRAKKTFSNVLYVENSENVGFSKACNQGIKLASGKYILFQNPDTLVVNQSIEKLTKYIIENPDIGIASGKLINKDGTLQYSIRRFPSILNQLFEAFLVHKFLPNLSKTFGEVILDENIYQKSNYVDWICGAIMLVSRDAIQHVGLLDESFFLYAEEVDWCYRMKQNGWNVAYYPNAKFVHFMGKAKANPELFIQNLKARKQFYYKHNSFIKAFLFDVASLLFLINRALLYIVKTAFRQTNETTYMRKLYIKSTKAFLSMMFSDG